MAEFQSLTGKGVTGGSTDATSRSATTRCSPIAGSTAGPLAADAEALRGDGQTVMFVAVDGRVAGLLGVADPIKATTPEALRGAARATACASSC